MAHDEFSRRRGADAAPVSPEAALGLPAAGAAETRVAVRKGLTVATVAALAETLGESAQGLADILGIPARTLARRRRERRLSPSESDLIYRAARIVARAVETLGSVEKARVWLRRPHRSLGGEAPLDLVDTDVGTRQVEEVLARIDHGVFA